MVKRTYNLEDSEPTDKKFDMPSEREHLLQVVDVYTCEDETGRKLGLDQDTVSTKCEVVGGAEEGRTLLVRASLDNNFSGFFATKLFLKAVGEPYKGEGILIDTDNWIGRQFYATVKHNGKYANISEYNFDKKIEQKIKPNSSDINWND